MNKDKKEKDKNAKSRFIATKNDFIIKNHSFNKEIFHDLPGQLLQIFSFIFSKCEL